MTLSGFSVSGCCKLCISKYPISRCHGMKEKVILMKGIKGSYLGNIRFSVIFSTILLSFVCRGIKMSAY